VTRCTTIWLPSIERIAGVWIPPSRSGVVDEKIDPAHTRSKLTQALPRRPAAAAGKEHPAVSSPPNGHL